MAGIFGTFGNDLPEQGGISGLLRQRMSMGDRLSTPTSQIALRLLMASQGRAGEGTPNLGAAIGSSVLGYQQDAREQQMQKLQADMLRARLDEMKQPKQQDKGRLIPVMGPDGKPVLQWEAESAGKQPYSEPAGQSADSALIQEWKASGEPDYFKFIERRSRLMNQPASDPLVAIQTPNGSVYVPRSQAAGATPAAPRENFVPTEGERTSANYLGRMQAAEKRLGDYKPGMMDYLSAEKWMEGGGVTSSAANMVMSEKGGAYYQAAADWVRAKLRKESGAVISPQEMVQEIRTYFPMPGDSPARIKQKQEARRQAEFGMQQMSGRAAPSAAVDLSSDPLGLR